jgi:catechol 2,3-dioxygenase-like lactoylglutathione lyase family enzyme
VFDHITLRVADLAVAEGVFDAILAPLDIAKTSSTSSFAEWSGFALTQADDAHPVTRGLHVAFVAPSAESVHAFWNAGVDAGLSDDGPPGPRPRYGADYYAGFVRDPNGNGIEAIHRDALRSGTIDHVAIRVADLTAATAFYRTISSSAGFDVRHDGGSNHTSFSAGASSGAFSLLRGRPTENLHMAFTGTDDAVRQFFEDAVAAGYRGNGEPGERPQYHAGYYAAYVLDPDGNNIEVVDHHRASPIATR